MNDQDEIFEQATETPITIGISAEAEGRAAEQPLGQCPSLVPAKVIAHDEPAADDELRKRREQSERDREIARQKRKIVWKNYATKSEICVMGRTQQNSKVYEVLVSKRPVATLQDNYALLKVNGKVVLTCSFTGGAWMLKKMLTAAAQELVNYKAKRNRDSRRNYAKRDAAKAAKRAQQQEGK